jgi:aldehyde:ferredoxin oxidoreductase
MNTREGVSRKDDTLPARFLLEDDPEDPRRRAVPLEPMLDRYYRIRGFDPEGVPTPETLEELGIPASAPREAGAQAAR